MSNDGYMTVKELNQSQLDFLKMDYCYGDETRDSEVSRAAANWLDIPDDVIFEHYAGIDFVPEDFGTAEDCEEENEDHRPLEYVGGGDYEETAE